MKMLRIEKGYGAFDRTKNRIT